MSYRVAWGERMLSLKYIVVGCGGTGGFVAEGLCRLLGPKGPDILLIDPDRVEKRNLKRQNFFDGEIGKFKSQALAERLSRLYGRRLGYSVWPFDPEMEEPSIIGIGHSRAIQGLIIGCVDDSTDARRFIGKAIDDHMTVGNWWIDAGNGHHSGQVLIGNTSTAKALQGGFDNIDKVVYRLPMPSLQCPALLVPPTKSRSQANCAEAVETEQQSQLINQAMANLVLQYVDQLRKMTLTWMGSYIDLEAGTRQNVPAEPETVARMLSVKVDTLFAQGCHIGNMSRPQYDLRSFG